MQFKHTSNSLQTHLGTNSFSKKARRANLLSLPLCSLLLTLQFLTGCDSVENPTETNTEFQSLSYDDFVANEVYAVFDKTKGDDGATCADAGCHHAITGTGGSFRIWPGITDPDSLEMRQNYLSAAAFIRLDLPEGSPLLLEPLAGSFPSVGEHAGGVQFEDTADADYLTIYLWASNPVANTQGGGESQ